MEKQQTMSGEHLRLSGTVIHAVESVYSVKTPTERLAARTAEREAVRALDAYRKEHG